MKTLPLLSLLLILFSFNYIQAQDSAVLEEEIMVEEEPGAKALEFSGSVDAYFRANLNGNTDASPGTSFANLAGFSLGMANLNVTKEGAKAGFAADLVFGPRGEDATFLSPFLRPGGNSSIVNQLYVYFNLSEKTTVTLGNFNTFLGYEVISPAANFNYSTSYLFSYGPFSHTGLKLDFDLGGGFSLMTGVFNPTDATEYNPSNDYVGGVQLGYNFDEGSIYLNTVVSEDFVQIDLTAGADMSDKVYVGLNASSASDNFFGVATYLQIQTTDNLKFGVRGEYFSDKGLGLFTKEENIIDLTLSANYNIDNLMIIPEFRVDIASEPVFADGADINESLASFVLAMVYGF